MTANTQDAKAQNDTPHLGIPFASNMLQLLLEKAADNLTIRELEWLSMSASEKVYCEIDNLHSVVYGIAGLVAEDKESGSFQSQKHVSEMMWSIAHQLDVIRGLEALAHNADVHIEYKKAETNAHKKTD